MRESGSGRVGSRKEREVVERGKLNSATQFKTNGE